MFEVVDYSDWSIYDGFSEGSGRSEKVWLRSDDGTIGLFKYPKMDPDSNETTYEHISEHLAQQLGDILGVDIARIELGIYNNRVGSMSYLINRPTEALCEGAGFILGKHPLYNPNTLQDEETGEYYSIKHLFELSDNKEVISFWIEMMLFDFLIGNRDRHQSNWAFIIPIEDRGKTEVRVRLCPLYDNGSSLCCFIKDDQVEDYIGNDKVRFQALVDTKSRSIIRIDSRNKKMPKHSEVVQYLMENYPETLTIADRFLERVTPESIAELIGKYPDDLIRPNRKKLIIKYLEEKVDILRKIRVER